MISPYLSRSNMERRGNERRRYSAFQPIQSSTAVQIKKGVTFKSTATVRTYSSNNESMTKEKKSKLYYSKRELNIFLLEVKAICTLSQGLPNNAPNSGTLLEVARDSRFPPGKNTNGDNVENTTESLRGLELLMYPKRKQNKILAHRSLLKYQTSLNCKPDINREEKRALLAAASAKLNMWSSFVAVETARLDSIRAYERNYRIQIDAPGPMADILPPSFYLKRQKRRRSRRLTLDADGATRQSKRRKTEQR